MKSARSSSHQRVLFVGESSGGSLGIFDACWTPTSTYCCGFNGIRKEKGRISARVAYSASPISFPSASIESMSDDFDLESLLHLEQTYAPLLQKGFLDTHFDLVSTTLGTLTALRTDVSMVSSKGELLVVKKALRCGRSLDSMRALR